MARTTTRAPRKGPGRRAPARSHRQRNTLPATERTNVLTVDLQTVEAVSGQATKKDLTFSRPVTANGVAVPAIADFVLASAGETDRYATDWEILAPNRLRATLSGALTAAKTYVGTIAAACGSVSPAPNIWGDRTASIIVP